MQVFPISEIAERIALASDNVRSFDVYSTHISNRNQAALLIIKIARDPNGNFNKDQIEYTQKLRGNFTVVIRPGNETFYISSDAGALPMQGNIDFMQMGGIPGIDPNMSTNEYIKRLIELERENTALKAELEIAKRDLSQFEDAGGKFSYALNNLLENFIFPKFAGTQPTNTPIQGTMHEIQNIPIQGTDEQKIEAAMAIILTAFGADWVVKFASRLQQDPSKISQIKSFLP